MNKKKHILYLLVVFTCLGAQLHSQHSYTDSLKREIYSKLHDSTVVKNLQILFQYYSNNNLDSARKYANLSLEIAQKIGSKRMLCVSYANLAELESLTGNYTAQIKYLSKALEIMEGSKDREGTMRINMRLCDAFMALNDTTNALLHLKKVRGLYNGLEEKNRRIIFMRMNHHYGMISLKRNDPKKALLYLDSALNSKDAKLIPWLHGKLLETTANAYAKLNNIPKAKEFYQKAIKANEEVNARSAITSCKEGLAALLLKENSPDSALAIITQAELTALKVNNAAGLLGVYDKFIEIYDKLGKHEKKAEYLERKLKLKDSLNGISFNQALADAQINLKNYEKEIENKLLNEQNKVLELEVENSRGHIILIIIIAISLVFILIVWNTYVKLKSEKANMELEHKLLRSQMNPHFMFNSLSTIQSFVLSENPLKAAKYISLFSTLMRKTLENSKRDYIFIEEEVSALSAYLELESIRMNNLFSYNLDYDAKEIGHLFIPPMLIQPYLENSIKHGIKNLPEDVPGEIHVFFRLEEGNLLCTIIDNGVGINKAMRPREPGHTSSGIEITKKRLELLCSNLKLKYYFKMSDRNETNKHVSGTIVEFNLPFKT